MVAPDDQTLDRVAARALLVDEQGRVLLLEGRDVSRPEVGTWWFTPGGGVDGGESPEEAVRREVYEETGIEIGELGPIVLERETEFDFEDVHYRQAETFYLVHVANQEVSATHWTEIEKRSIVSTRWWNVDELATTDAVVYPETLASLLHQIANPEEPG